jgi:hypothetical protein
VVSSEILHGSIKVHTARSCIVSVPYCCIHQQVNRGTQELDIRQAKEGAKSINQGCPDVQLMSEANAAVMEDSTHNHHWPIVTTVQINQYIHTNYQNQRIGSYDVVQGHDLQCSQTGMKTKWFVDRPKEVQVPHAIH